MDSHKNELTPLCNEDAPFNFRNGEGASRSFVIKIDDKELFFSQHNDMLLSFVSVDGVPTFPWYAACVENSAVHFHAEGLSRLEILWYLVTEKKSLIFEKMLRNG